MNVERKILWPQVQQAMDASRSMDGKGSFVQVDKNDWPAVLRFIEKGSWQLQVIDQVSSPEKALELIGNDQLISDDKVIDVVALQGASGHCTLIFLTNGPHHSFERLELVLARAASLDDFLKRPKLQNMYYAALSAYFGKSRCSRPAFNAILLQLKKVLPMIPELGQRLWEKRDPPSPSYSVQVENRNYGRGFVRENLETFLAESFRKFRTHEFSHEETQQHLLKALATISENNGATDVFREQRALPINQRLAQSLVKKFFQSEHWYSRLDGADADAVLAFLHRLEQEPGEVLHAQNFYFESGFWLSLIRDQLPKVAKLLKHHEIFPILKRQNRAGKTVDTVRLHEARYYFRSPSRLFHGLWRGIPLKDCVGGHHDDTDNFLPERWANLVLKNSHIYYVEKNNAFHGQADLIPFRLGQNEFYSIDTRWQHFYVKNGQAPSLFEKWLEQEIAVLPGKIQGFVVGHSYAGRTPGEQNILTGLPCYSKGRPLGEPSDIRFSDPIADQIIFASEKLGFSPKYRKVYGRTIITDVSLPDAGPLRLLQF